MASPASVHGPLEEEEVLAQKEVMSAARNPDGVARLRLGIGGTARFKQKGELTNGPGKSSTPSAKISQSEKPLGLRYQRRGALTAGSKPLADIRIPVAVALGALDE